MFNQLQKEISRIEAIIYALIIGAVSLFFQTVFDATVEVQRDVTVTVTMQPKEEPTITLSPTETMTTTSP